jgi:uncharacterized membrane protein
MKTASYAGTLSAAVGLAMSMHTSGGAVEMREDPQVAQQMMSFIKKKMEKEHLEMCYGINAAGKNDCGTATHSCHGYADQERDPASFVLVPTGVCSKIAGGRLQPA